MERAFTVVLQQCLLKKVLWMTWYVILDGANYIMRICPEMSRTCQLALIDFVMASKRKFKIILTILEVWYSKEYSRWFCQTLKIGIVPSLFPLDGQLALTDFSKAGKWNSTWYFLSNNFISKHSAPFFIPGRSLMP